MKLDKQDTINGSMAHTIEKIEESMSAAGFATKIPYNTELLAGGDGNNVENCPIGYYKFHFWKNDEQWKEHENWISNTDIGGPICISLIEEEHALIKKHFYRLVIRSLFAYKSLILCEEDIAAQFAIKGKKLTRNQILGISLREFIAHEMENVTNLEEEFGAMSIRSTCSINSLSNELARSLPSSRLREASQTQNSIEAAFVSRSNSIRSVSSDESSRGCGEGNCETMTNDEKLYATLRKNFKELCNINTMEFVKTFTQVKDKEFYHVLLNLERVLFPQVAHFDVVIAGDTPDAITKNSWETFSKMLGEPLSTNLYRDQNRYLVMDGRIPAGLIEDMRARNQFSDAPQLSKNPLDDGRRKLKKSMIVEFTLNEIKYLRKLQSIRDAFMEPLSSPIESQVSLLTPTLPLISPDIHGVIFEGIPNFITLHARIINNLLAMNLDLIGETKSDLLQQKLEDLCDKSILTGRKVAEVLLDNLQGLYCYSNIMSTFEERERLLKNLLETCPSFRAYAEAISEKEPGRTLIDQDLGNLFQHVMRYVLQLSKVIENTEENDDEAPILLRVHREVDTVIHAMQEVKKNHDSVNSAFTYQYRIHGCPPAIISPRRAFIMKMASYSVCKGEVDFSSRYTLYLFDDVLMIAKKRRGREGKIESVANQRHNTIVIKSHDFELAAPIGAVELKHLKLLVKARNRSSRAFSIDLGSELDANLVNTLTPRYSNLLLVPKNLRKMLLFQEKFTQVKQQHILMTSNSTLAVQHLRYSDASADFYFNIYQQPRYTYDIQRNRIAILLLQGGPVPELTSIFPAGEVDVLILIQALNGGYRLFARARETLVASGECIEASRDFQPPEQLAKKFLKALFNSYFMHFIYPPFSQSTQALMRQQLQRHIEPFSRGVFRKFKEMTNKLRRTKEVLTPMGQPIDDYDPYAVEDGNDEIPIMSLDKSKSEALFTKEAKTKSLFGRMVGKLKSPLSK